MSVVAHEAPRSGGFAGELVASINEEVLLYLVAPVERVTGFDTLMPMLAQDYYPLPNPPRIEAAIERVLEY